MEKLAKIKALTNQAGGITYHLKGLRYKDKLWQPFRDSLFEWLNTWKAESGKLLLIGPSGGYTLPKEFINKFHLIDAIEPDPLSEYIFKRRFKGPVDIRWHNLDTFIPADGMFSLSRLENLLKIFPNHDILFCNFLGQLKFLYPETCASPAFTDYKRALTELLESRSFASYHDRFSTKLLTLHLNKILSLNQASSIDFLVSYYYGDLNLHGIEIQDHLTGDLFEKRPRKVIPWQLKPTQIHFIECVRS